MSFVAAILIIATSCIAFPDDPFAVEDFTIAEFPLATAWHSGAQCMAFLSDREVVAVCFDVPSEKWYHHTWDFRSKKQLRKTEANSSSYAHLDVSPDGESMLVCDWNGVVEILAKDGKKIADFRVFENRNNVLEARFLSNDEVGVVEDNVLLRRNFRTGESKQYRLNGETCQGATIARKPGTLCWVDSKSLHVWNPMLKDTWDIVKLSPASDSCYHVACSDDGSRAMCASLRSELELFDVKTKRSLKKWDPHKGWPLAHIFALRNDLGFITGSEEGKLMIWGRNGELKKTLMLRRPDAMISFACNEDSTLLAISSGRRGVIVCDLKRVLDHKTP